MWCGGKLEAQFVNEYGFVGRGIIVLPQGGLIHWGCCLKCFMTSFRRGLLIVLKTWMWGWGAPCTVGRRSHVLVLCSSSSAWGFGFVVFDRTCVWASFCCSEECPSCSTIGRMGSWARYIYTLVLIAWRVV